jgi:2-polyprenyl-3-methyl-5-hydroxy-6-metoxy-1,4-benzoquinol methylase
LRSVSAIKETLQLKRIAGLKGPCAEPVAVPYSDLENSHTTGNAMSSGKVIRDCILCGSSEYDELFSYTLDFLVSVRGQDEATQRQKGWSDDTTSTIVRCRRCDCRYIRDVLLPSRDFLSASSKHAKTPKSFEERTRHRAKKETFKQYGHFDYENHVVRSLILISALERESDVRFLDFGAGGGDTSNMARACGVNHVVAYDPYWVENIQEHFDHENFSGIQCVRSRDDLHVLGPFDVAVFQSAIEHVLDPRGELQAIFNLLAPGGYLYVNNPVMNIVGELNQLRSAETIKKRDRISYYHPGHLNYMLPKHFERILREVGFEIKPWAFYPPVPFVRGLATRSLLPKLKTLVRTAQNILGAPYSRHVYVVRKPALAAGTATN